MNKIEYNYIIADNIDFYNELNDSDYEETIDNYCLISQKPLNENAIVLNCNHQFNLVEIYNEVKRQKIQRHSSLDKTINSLKRNEFLCPYCRQKQTLLLPHIKNAKLGMCFHIGVNSPQALCMPFHTCVYKNKSGKNKGKTCDCPAFSYDGNALCGKHYNVLQKKTSTSSTTQHICGAILKSGKNKGQPCGAKIVDSEATFCKRHIPKT
jgi:hypothetical protein